MFKKLIPIALMYACGTEPTRKVAPVSFSEYLNMNVPSVVRPHFAEFIEHCKNSSVENQQKCQENIKLLSSVELKNGPIEANQPGVVGLCELSLNRKIILRADVFNFNSLTFKALVWHELGHCLLDLDHTSENDYSHIMNAYLPNERELGKKWSFYTDDLFNSDARMHLAESIIYDWKQ